VRQSPYMYGNRPPKRISIWVLIAIIAAMSVLLSLLASLTNQSSESTGVLATVEAEYALESTAVSEGSAEVTEEEQPTRAKPAATVPATEGSYSEIRNVYISQSITDWTSYARALVGAQVAWSGVLTSVHSQDELWLTMVEPGSDIPQVVLHLSDNQSALQEGDTLSFIGTVSRIVVMNQTVMVHLENVEITGVY